MSATACIAPDATTVTACAPGKVILFGEHAINRGQPALAAAVGLRARCSVRPSDTYRFRGGGQDQTATRHDILTVGLRVNRARAANDLEEIRAIGRSDFFAPQKFILAAAFGEHLPDGFDIEWSSEVPGSSGLGSGASAFTAMVTALAGFFAVPPTREDCAAWAHLGDVVAHGGVASALDSQTSLIGGVIRYTGHGLASPVACAPGLALVIAHTGVRAPTSEVNSRVRCWIEERPDSRLRYVHTIGALTRAAEPALKGGYWDELGRLMLLNQLVLEKIGVSCPEADRLIEAALAAGAFGAKVSGSGGGGIIVALTSPENRASLAKALVAAGGEVFTPEIAVPGATLLSSP